MVVVFCFCTKNKNTMKKFKDNNNNTYNSSTEWLQALVGMAQFDIDQGEYKSAMLVLAEMQQVLAGNKSRYEI